MKMFKNFFKKENKLPDSLKNLLQPESDFIKKGKDLFLSEFERKFSPLGHEAPGFPFIPNLVPNLVFAVLVIFLTAGVSSAVYADAKNVGPDNPLYILKRYGELFSIALAKNTDKPGLHIKFAKRRAEEIRTIKNSNPKLASSTEVTELTEDLNFHVEESFVKEEKVGAIKKFDPFCKSIENVLNEEFPAFVEVFQKNLKLSEKFDELENKCQSLNNSTDTFPVRKSKVDENNDSKND